jgi:hypothetical protein
VPRVPPAFDPVKYMIAEREKFSDPADWRRSKRGNLWREWDGMTVTIFHRNGRYFWCIADGGEERRFSLGGFEIEDDAMSSVGDAMGVGVI